VLPGDGNFSIVQWKKVVKSTPSNRQVCERIVLSRDLSIWANKKNSAATAGKKILLKIYPLFPKKG